MDTRDALYALSPLDGRYQSLVQPLRDYFSEFALMQYRLQVEVSYLLSLSKQHIVRAVTPEEQQLLSAAVHHFSLDDAKRIKAYEGEVRHDVKALEYFLKDKLDRTSLVDLLPFVHFGLTSDDVNNLAYGLTLSHAHTKSMLPALEHLCVVIATIADKSAGCLMLARTHGQPAVPTTFGKELAVFYVRLKKLQKKLQTFHFEGKCNGAVGNYNALAFAFPDIDWLTWSENFISSLGLTANLVTTQLLPYDNYVEYFSLLGLVNTILIGLSQDMWQYIRGEIVGLKKDAKQVGSSTMPQKVNPIDFENAEGNLQVANAYIELYGRKFPVSRLQRDLSDSTVKRTIGSTLGHTLIAWKSLEKGLGKIAFHKKSAEKELNNHWEVLAEAMQVFLKVHGNAKGFELVKSQLMGKTIDKKTFRRLVRQFPPLAKLTPSSYSGLAKKITELALRARS
ncbi:adenylosuccinate lyase [Candidatus Gottesmanbacteria bacterium]|nr:adenylosuccinate lyase [Candidatus Gottesmanbacteria bacterium]